MIKAVFFDWFNTLARYDPPREEIQSQALKEFGIDIPAGELAVPLLEADRYIFEENAHYPIRKMSPEEQTRIFSRYEQILLNHSGLDFSSLPADLPVKVYLQAQKVFQSARFVLFDDVLPTLSALKARGLLTGLLTNMDTDMWPVCRELGLEKYLDFIVTSIEVGSEKPKPRIFQAGLEKAGVKAEEAVHVGDQYNIDAKGAAGVGIKAVLVDRQNQSTEVKDFPVVSSLDGVLEYI